MANENTVQALMRLRADMEKRAEIAAELQGNDPLLSYVSALIIAGDITSKERADERMRDGFTFWEAAVTIGSFARLDWIVDNYERYNVPLKEVLDNLPEEWRNSDPNDTDPKFLRMWEHAFAANGRKYIRDGKPLPRNKYLKIYRGQDENTQFGISWTLDKSIAEKFARGAGTRQSNRPGVVYIAYVQRDKVMAYLTGREESEVIVNPVYLPIGSSYIPNEKG